MRRGECLGLKWSDINFEAMEINIERIVSTVALIEDDGTRNNVTITQNPKTSGSFRTIPLPISLKNIFDKVKISNNKNRLKLRFYHLYARLLSKMNLVHF